MSNVWLPYGARGSDYQHNITPKAPERMVTERDRPLGTAQWAQPGTGDTHTFKSGDIYLGQTTTGTALGQSDDRHVFVGAGTRGGKGVSVIVPNLILWRGSVVALDPKGELAMVTARHRAGGSPFCHGMRQTVRILDPFGVVRTDFDDFADLKVGFNPMDDIRPGREDSVDQAARIAESIIVSESSSDPFWDDSARQVLKAVILHTASSELIRAKDRNLCTVRTLLMVGDLETRNLTRPAAKEDAPLGFSLLIAAMRRNPAFGGVIISAGEMLAQLESSPRTLSSILQIVRTNTDFLDAPAMKRSLERSDFHLSELKTAPNGTTIYLCLPQSNAENYFRWLRMIINLTIAEMERVRQRPASGHRVLIVLDEFPALRRMKAIENAAAQIAGFGVKLMFVVQTLAQLKDIYKDNWETLLASASVKLFFCNDDQFTREYVSKLAGESEIVRSARSGTNTFGSTQSHATANASSFTFGESFGGSDGTTSGTNNSSHSSGSNSGRSASQTTSFTDTNTHGTTESYSLGYSDSVQKRPLINPDEIGRLFGDTQQSLTLALIGGHQPMMLARCPYYRVEWFEGYFDPHPDHPLPPGLSEVESRKQARLEKRLADEALKRRQQVEAQERTALKERAERLRAERLRKQRENAQARADERRCEQERLARQSYWLTVGTIACVVTPAAYALITVVLHLATRPY